MLRTNRSGMTWILKQMAQTTAGFTGADLENLLNESAIHRGKGESAPISQQDDIKRSFRQGRDRHGETEPCNYRKREKDHGVS